MGLTTDEQHARGRRRVFLLGCLDAVPHDAHAEAVDGEASLLAGFVEGLSRVELEEDDFGSASVVLAVRLGRVDVSGVNASRGTHGMNGSDETMSSEGRGQVDQEKGAVQMVGDVGRPVAR